MWSIDACLYSYCLTFFLSLSLFTFSFSLHVFSSLFFPPSFTIHGYPFLYYLPLQNLPLLPLNHFWLLVGIFLRLPINLLVVQPFPLPRVCSLHHSPFPDKINCLTPYLCGQKGGVATYFFAKPRNHIYSVLSKKDLMILLPKIWVWI